MPNVAVAAEAVRSAASSSASWLPKRSISHDAASAALWVVLGVNEPLTPLLRAIDRIEGIAPQETLVMGRG